MKKKVSQPYLQAHCQSPTSQRSVQSFVKELSNASPRNRLSGRI